MATTRINARIRDIVIDNAIKGPLAEFALKKEELDATQARIKLELQRMAYDTCFSEKDQRLMKQLPDTWLPLSRSAHVQIDGHVQAVKFDVERPVPFRSSEHCYGSKPVLAVLDEGHPYLLKLEEYRVAHEAADQHSREYHEKRRYLKAKVTAIVESVTTVNRLIQIWPEVVDFLPEAISDPITGVPAVMIEDLNRELGITTKKETTE